MMEETLLGAGKAVLEAAKTALSLSLSSLVVCGNIVVAAGSAAMLVVMAPVLLGSAALCMLLGLMDDAVA